MSRLYLSPSSGRRLYLASLPSSSWRRCPCHDGVVAITHCDSAVTLITMAPSPIHAGVVALVAMAPLPTLRWCCPVACRRLRRKKQCGPHSEGEVAHGALASLPFALCAGDVVVRRSPLSLGLGGVATRPKSASSSVSTPLLRRPARAAALVLPFGSLTELPGHLAEAANASLSALRPKMLSAERFVLAAGPSQTTAASCRVLRADPAASSLLSLSSMLTLA